jgi:2-polyprenyl-3-methyl-5-hydroxy-6-metoxy-1,4-benzoquinol methylase
MVDKSITLENIKPLINVIEYRKIEEKEYREYFIDKSTGRVKPDFLDKRRCCVCLSDSNRAMFENDGLKFVSCTNCGFVYIDPYIIAKEKGKYYKDSKALNNFFKNIVIKTRDRRIDLIWRSRINMLKEYVPQGNVLDVGCGSGEFLECMKREGKYKITGIEPNAFAADFANNRLGGQVLNVVLEEAKLLNGHFHLVTFWEALSHLNNPDIALNLVYESLKTGGYLFISSPNFSGFEYKILGRYHNDVNFKIPNYFDIDTLSKLLVRVGFEVVEVSTPGRLDVQHVQQKLNLSPDKIRMDSFWNDLFLDQSRIGQERRDALQVFIRNHKLSGSMLVIARKP